MHVECTYLPMKMEQTECSETSAYKIQTQGNHPKETIQQWTGSGMGRNIGCCEDSHKPSRSLTGNFCAPKELLKITFILELTSSILIL